MQMELTNCRHCKKLFNYITGERICPSCKDALEKKFVEVKQYIKDNPGVNVDTVAENCEVSARQIKQWVREERLTFTDDSLVGLECERCGRMVHSGRFCKDCAGVFEDGFNNAYRKDIQLKPRDKNSRMRFLDN